MRISRQCQNVCYYPAVPISALYVRGSAAESEALRAAAEGNGGVAPGAMFADHPSRSKDRPKLRALMCAVARGEIAKILVRRIEEFSDAPHRAFARAAWLREHDVVIEVIEDTWISAAEDVVPRVAAVLAKQASLSRSRVIRAALGRARSRGPLGRPPRAIPQHVLSIAAARMNAEPFAVIARDLGIPDTTLRRALRAGNLGMGALATAAPTSQTFGKEA